LHKQKDGFRNVRSALNNYVESHFTAKVKAEEK